ncbi:MAG: glycosyltransferase [Hyphomicrobiaceae bacterium]
MYSHDTFGLGHLRRTQAIAHALVARHKGLSVLIISGSSIAGAFDFKARVDFVKVPSVIKLRSGEYSSLSEHIDISCTLEMRRSMIEQAAVHFAPDLFIVDKEARGLRRELDPTLPRLKAMGCRLVLGLRDVLDEPEVVRAEWERNEIQASIEAYYDDIWIYGSRDFANPLAGVPLSPDIERKITYTGYIARSVPRVRNSRAAALPEGFVLVTAGGGGDGIELMRQVLAAKELDRANRDVYVLVPGPFMKLSEKSEVRRRAARVGNVHVFDFDSHIEALMQKAGAVISMGGYNTFCELMSFDKRVLMVPRVAPRKEQLIRARRAVDFGLIDLIEPAEAADPVRMAAAMAALVKRPRPSQISYRIDLGGLDRITRMAQPRQTQVIGRDHPAHV